MRKFEIKIPAINALSLLDNVEMKHQYKNMKVQTMFFLVLFTFSSGLERERLDVTFACESLFF